MVQAILLECVLWILIFLFIRDASEEPLLFLNMSGQIYFYASDWDAKNKRQNQCQCACLIKKQLETFIFVLC